MASGSILARVPAPLGGAGRIPRARVARYTALLALACLCACRARDLRTEGEVRPLAVLIERYADAEVIGAESPTWALYSDGTVICSRWIGAEHEYLTWRLSGREMRRVVGVLESALHAGGDLDVYRLSRGADLPDTQMWLFGKRTIRLYGFLRVRPRSRRFDSVEEEDLFREVLLEDEAEIARHRRGVPEPILSAYRMMTEPTDPMAVPWIPPRVELLVHPFENAGSAVPWPAGWPELSARDAGGGPGVRSLDVSGRRLGEVRALMGSLGTGEGVRMRGRAWAFGYRVPFPLEERWFEIGRDSIYGGQGDGEEPASAPDTEAAPDEPADDPELDVEALIRASVGRPD